MKKLINAAIIIFIYISAFGQARPGAYLWTVKVNVVDENGIPVLNANTVVGYSSSQLGQLNQPSRSAGATIAGLTDTNGFFMASHTDWSPAVAVQVKKEGYYLTYFHHEVYMPGQFDDQKVAASRMFDQKIVLKKIHSPIAMYAKRITHQPPRNHTPMGYDLMVGDWVSPYGKGTNSDMIFQRDFSKKSLQDYDYKLTVTFPKAADGILEFPVTYKNGEGSALRSPYEAPTDGYQSGIVRLNISHPGHKLINDSDENRVYIFRVRTVVDADGNTLSAYYGKIYGDFMDFSYYLNPTSNDRNLEFDVHENLIKKLKFDESVRNP